MNYQANIKKTYNIDIDGFAHGVGAIALLESGSQLDIDAPTGVSYNYDTQLYYYVNYVHRNVVVDDEHVDDVAMLLVGTPYNFTLVCSTKVDYVLMGSYTGSVLSAYSKRQNGTYYDIGDGVPLTNYPQYNPNADISDFNYGQYLCYFDDNYAVYDFSSVQNTNVNNYRSDSLYLRGENLSFYNSYLSFYNLDSNYTLSLSYGSPIYESGNTEYERGYVNGYSSGSVEGYQNGYEDGVTIGGMDTNSATAFSYLGGAFNAVSGIMSLEVLPHITLGLIWTIPVVFAIITLIFKLVRK